MIALVLLVHANEEDKNPGVFQAYEASIVFPGFTSVDKHHCLFKVPSNSHLAARKKEDKLDEAPLVSSLLDRRCPDGCGFSTHPSWFSTHPQMVLKHDDAPKTHKAAWMPSATKSQATGKKKGNASTC
jgi:hypothetical protein